jgi:hypothetical protein
MQHRELIPAGVVSAAAAAFHSIRMEPSFAVKSAVVAFYDDRMVILYWKLVNQCVHPVIVFGPSLG